VQTSLVIQVTLCNNNQLVSMAFILRQSGRAGTDQMKKTPSHHYESHWSGRRFSILT